MGALRPFSLIDMSRALAFAALLVLSAPLAGCATRYIPNSDVEDTSENRKLIAFCEKYRLAVQDRDVQTLLKMASPDHYYENGGNVDATDDIDYEGLKQYLTTKFSEVSAVRYEIRYRRVVRTDKVIYVDYTYSASYKIPGAKGDEWRRKVEDNRLEIIPNKDEFLIIAGM